MWMGGAIRDDWFVPISCKVKPYLVMAIPVYDMNTYIFKIDMYSQTVYIQRGHEHIRTGN